MLCWCARLRFVVPRRGGADPQRGGQYAERLGDERTQCSERGLGLEARAHRAHLGDAPGEWFGEEPDDDAQDVMDETSPALDPAHRPWELDGVASQRIGRGGQTRGLLGVGHPRFEGIELTGKASGQTVRRQAEGGCGCRDTTRERSASRAGLCARRWRGAPANSPRGGDSGSARGLLRATPGPERIARR